MILKIKWITNRLTNVCIESFLSLFIKKDEKMFFNVIKASFMRRRKTLLNGLTNSGLIKSKEEGKTLLSKLSLPENTRGENLTIEQFAKLSDELSK